jgi:hypothetical protein
MPNKPKAAKSDFKKKAPPACPLHHDPMGFNADRNEWECVIEGCRLVALPKDYKSRVVKVTRNGWQTVVAADPSMNHGYKIILYSAEQDIQVDFTALVMGMTMDQDISGKTSIAFDIDWPNTTLQ